MRTLQEKRERFGGQLIRVRQALGYTRKEFSKYLYIDVTTLRGWEIAKASPRPKYYGRLISAASKARLWIDIPPITFDQKGDKDVQRRCVLLCFSLPANIGI